MSTALRVIAAGAVTPVGLTSAQTCTAVRAGVCAFAESGFVLSTPSFEPIVAATVPLRPRPARSTPRGRVSALARVALEECLRAGGLDPARTVLLLGTPEPDRIERFSRWFDEDLHAGLRTGILRFFHPASVLVPHGNTSALAGMLRARELLGEGSVDACVVGGVDSFVNAADLDEVERTWRLHREGEAHGLVPGEAAAFVAVTTAGRSRGRSSLGQIAGIGLDREDAETTVLSDGHPTGRGLQRALQKAAQDADVLESAIGLRLTDLNGERYGAMDSLLALSRFYRTDRDGLPIWHPAECVGETGAAVGALLVQIACHAIVRGYSPSTAVMCETSSATGQRAACLVRPGDR